MNYYALNPPQKWQAGMGGDKPLYFDCADCGAVEPEIAGFMGDAPNYAWVAVFKVGDFYKNAMFCKDCFERRIAENERREVISDEI